jgi:hypothetical protein
MPYRAASVHEVRYGSADLGQGAALGDGLTYTGVFAGAAFEDQLFQTTVHTGYVVQGHPAVASDVDGGNGTLAWEVAPGVVAYVGYSGNSLSAAAIAALLDLAVNSHSATSQEWDASSPLSAHQFNGPQP